MGYIENVHKKNWEIIRSHNLKEGMILRRLAFPYEECRIDTIHPLYGWVVTVPQMLRQDMSNLDEFIIDKEC